MKDILKGIYFNLKCSDTNQWQVDIRVHDKCWSVYDEYMHVTLKKDELAHIRLFYFIVVTLFNGEFKFTITKKVKGKNH